MAFLPNRGTDSEITVVTNIIAEAKKLQLGIDLLSWDIAKAFDSVHRKIQFLAWIRMGIPQAVAEMLVELDINGLFILKSPYAMDTLYNSAHMSPAQRHKAQRQLGFPVGRGYTQGDVLSTLGWVFLFDIVITAAKITRPNLHIRLRGLGSTLHTSGIVGFADDFITITVPELTSHLAVTTSAVYAILGLTSAVHKFRAITSHPGDRSIMVYDHLWHSTLVPFKNASHNVKVLGVLINLDLNWTAQFNEVRDKLHQTIHFLKCKRSKLSTKLMVLKIAIIPKLLYPAAKIGLSDSQLGSLTAITDVLYTHRHIEKTFPKFLLRSSFSPLRTPDLKKLILTHQYNTLMRVQNEPYRSPGNLAATGLALDAIRESQSDDLSITGYDMVAPGTAKRGRAPTLPATAHPATALLHHLSSHGIRLHVKGFHGADKSLPALFASVGLPLNDDARGILAAAEVSYINELLELHTNSEGNSQWAPASWIPSALKIFGYNQSNLEASISEYIVQMDSIMPKPRLPSCRLAQGQLLALRSSTSMDITFFDCAGINLDTCRAEGSLYHANKPCVDLKVLRATTLHQTQGEIRLGVTGNYSISLTELQSQYVGRAIAVDYTRKLNGPSTYKLLHIHDMDITFSIAYLQIQKHVFNNRAWRTDANAVCSTATCTLLPHAPISIFSNTGEPAKASTGLILSSSINHPDIIQGLCTDLSHIPNITTLGAETLMGAIMLQTHFVNPVIRLSLGTGLSSGTKSRRYRRGNINLPYGILWRRGNKDGTSLKQYAHIGRNKINSLDNPLLANLVTVTAATSRALTGSHSNPPGGDNVITVPCLDLFTTLLNPGEIFCTINDYPILGNPFQELHLEQTTLLEYLTNRVRIYESAHNWMADSFGLYPHISNIMINEHFIRRKALCRQMYDHFYCNSVKVKRLNLPAIQDQCACCPSHPTETPEHVLYCNSQLRSLYRSHAISDMARASQEIPDKYTRMYSRNILFLLFDCEGDSKRSLWMGRPTLPQLKCLEQHMDPQLHYPHFPLVLTTNKARTCSMAHSKPGNARTS